MPAIGRRSTKPLNDPPRRNGVPRPLYFNLGNPPAPSSPRPAAPVSYSSSSPSRLPSPPPLLLLLPLRLARSLPHRFQDAKLPHFSVLTSAGRRRIDDRAYGNAIASRFSRVLSPIEPRGDLPPPDVPGGIFMDHHGAGFYGISMQRSPSRFGRTRYSFDVLF